MEESPERAELRRIQREQERERRRIRDRQRRQSMTEEQRERHLARRRRNYQLRRQRAANNAHVAPFIPSLPLESSAGEASTSDEFHGSTSLDYSVIVSLPNHGLNQGQEVSHQGSTLHLETLVYKLDDSSRKLRLNRVKQLARNRQLVAELKEREDVTVDDSGSKPKPISKSLRLISVKRLARSMYSVSKETTIQKEKDNNLPTEDIQLLGNESCSIAPS